MSSTTLDKWALARRRVLLVVAGGVPLLFLRFTSDPINIPKLTLLLIGASIAGALYVAEVSQGHPTARIRPLLLPVGAVAVPLLVAWVASPYRWWGLLGDYGRFLGLIPYLAVIVCCVVAADSFYGRVRPLAWALAAAGAVAGAYALIQALGLDPFEWQSDSEASKLIVSTLGNPNFAGGFLAVVLPVGLQLALTDAERRVAAIAATGLIAAGCVAAGSQGALVAAVGGCCVVAGSAMRSRFRWAPMAATVVVVALALAVVGAVLAGTFGIVERSASDTLERRAQWWSASKSMVAANPLVGQGPNSFAVEHPRFRTIEDADTVALDITDDPHSVPLSFATAAGLLGFVGFLTMAGWILFRGGPAALGNPLGAAFLGACSAYLIQSMVSIDTVALRTTFWFALAGLVAASGTLEPERGGSKKRKKAPKQPALTRLPALVGLLLFTLVAVWWSFGLLLADMRFADAREQFASGDVRAAQATFRAAIDHRGEPVYRRTYGNSMGDVAVGVGREDGAPFLREAEEAFSYLDDLPEVNGFVDLAHLLVRWSALAPEGVDGALDSYRLAVRFDPVDRTVVNEAINFGFANQRYAEVEEILGESELLPEDTGLTGWLALALAHQGEVEAARAAAERALADRPDEASALQALQVLKDHYSD